MEGKIVSKNILFTVLLQLTIMISGLIVPRVILIFFGSTINGLVSSINQFLTYGSLLEGGVGMVITASLYEPLQKHDLKKVSGIVNASKKFCTQMGEIYAAYSLVVVLIFTFFIKTDNPKWFVALLVMVLALSSIIQYMLSMSFRLLLNADRKVFFVSLTQIIIVLSNLALVILIANLTKNIVLVKLGSALVYLIQPLMYNTYVHKHYKLDEHALPDKAALKHRWDGFGQQVAYFVSANTDIIVITFFLGLKSVSVYSVYSLVGMALSNLLVAVSNAIVPSIGNIIATHNSNKIKQAFNNYEFGMVIATSIFYTCAIILLLPFVGLYTKGINDANYYQPLFGILLMLSSSMYCLSEPYVNTCYAAGHIRQLSGYSYIEAIINITLSLLLVNKYGLIGIILGTMISYLYRLIVHINYLNRRVIKRNNKRLIKMILGFGIVNLVLIKLIEGVVPYTLKNYFEFFECGILVFIIVVVFNLGMGLILFRKEFCSLMQRSRSKLWKK